MSNSGRPKYKAPILTNLLQLTGALTLVFGLFAVIALFGNGPYGIANGNPYGLGGAFVTAGGILISALLQFGVAQVINYVGQIAYNTSIDHFVATRDEAS